MVTVDAPKEVKTMEMVDVVIIVDAIQVNISLMMDIVLLVKRSVKHVMNMDV